MSLRRSRWTSTRVEPQPIPLGMLITNAHPGRLHLHYTPTTAHPTPPSCPTHRRPHSQDFLQAVREAGPQLAPIPGLLGWRCVKASPGAAVIVAWYTDGPAADFAAITLKGVWSAMRSALTQVSHHPSIPAGPTGVRFQFDAVSKFVDVCSGMDTGHYSCASITRATFGGWRGTR